MKDIPCLDRISVNPSETQMANGVTTYGEVIVKLPNNLSRFCLARANIPTPVQIQSREPNFQAPPETPSFYIQNTNNGNESNPCGTDSDFPDGITLLMQNYYVPHELRSVPGDQHTTIHMTNGEEGIQLVTQEAEGNIVAAQSPLTPVTLENFNPGEEKASLQHDVLDTDDSGDYRPIQPERDSLHSMIDANQYGGMIAHPESNGPIMMNSVLNNNFQESGEYLHDHSQVSGTRPQIGTDDQTGLHHHDSMPVRDGAYNPHPSIDQNPLRHNQPNPIHEVSSTNQFPTIHTSDGNLDLGKGRLGDFLNSHSWAELSEICFKIPPNDPEQGIQYLTPGAGWGRGLESN
jgi:hypothetical protein